MGPLEVVVILGVCLVIGSVAARRLRIAAPLVLVVIGLVLGFVPDVREVHLPPEIVLAVFLPALLFWESLTTSLRAIRRDLRGILLNSTLLVVASAFAVAGLAHLLGMPWTSALILGAAVAPTDATAVSALARAMPRRNVDLLKAESLINDGTALVIYAIAVGLATGEDSYTGWAITGMAALSYLGGGVFGLLVGWIGVAVLGRLPDSRTRSVAFLVVPFLAFLLAELARGSGVIAVVVAGLLLSQRGATVTDARSRRETVTSWSLAAHVLNAALFVLVGVEVQNAVRGISAFELGWMLLLVLLAWTALILVRFGFLVTAAYTIRLLDRRPSQRLRRVSNRARVVSALAGFRGAISLAAALAVPLVVASGAPFPGRNTIVFVAAGVIVLSLIVQGLLLPVAIRWAGFPEDTSARDELALAERVTTEAAIAAIPEVAEQLGVDRIVRDRLLADYREHRAVIGADDSVDDEPLRRNEEYVRLRLAILARKHDAVLALRDQGAIDDPVLQRVQARLDLEELRLSRGEPAE